MKYLEGIALSLNSRSADGKVRNHTVGDTVAAQKTHYMKGDADDDDLARSHVSYEHSAQHQQHEDGEDAHSDEQQGVRSDIDGTVLPMACLSVCHLLQKLIASPARTRP